MNNTRFATAIHILTLLAHAEEEWLTSDYIAGSININPAVVRKELIVLQQAGFVVGRKGKEGGTKLCKAGSSILLSDIYLAVKNSEVLGKKNMQTNPKCPIGKVINSKLDNLFSETDQIVLTFLGQKTLSDFRQEFV